MALMHNLVPNWGINNIYATPRFVKFLSSPKREKPAHTGFARFSRIRAGNLKQRRLHPFLPRFRPSAAKVLLAIRALCPSGEIMLGNCVVF